MSQDETGVHLPGQLASNNLAPIIQVAGDNSGSISILRRLKLPFSPIPEKDIKAATEPLWAHTPTPQRAAEYLALHGFAIISGEHGTGRRISAVRALHTYLSERVRGIQLFDVSADWDDEETPDREVFPDPLPARGYLIDATSRTFSQEATIALSSWAERLYASGSCVIIMTNQRDWKGDSRLQVDAIRPDAIQVAYNYLANRASSSMHAQWLQLDPNQATSRGIFSSSAHDPTVGIFSDLITRSVSPSDSISIAERLSRIDPQRLANAVSRRNDKSSPTVQQQGREELERIREEVLLWTNFLEKVVTEPGTRGQDRVMLLSAAYLEGAPLETCIKAAADFGPRDEATTRRYREGRSPRRRMRDVGVDVTLDDKAAFESRPGLALSAIHMDWHHWADERSETRKWIERITAPDGLAGSWAEQIGDRLLHLSRAAVDPPFFAVLDAWTNYPGGVDKNRIHIIARLLTQAARTSELARGTHKKLLEWSIRKNPYQRQAVAQVCTGEYGRRWPHTALVRLRHILAINDAATEAAAHTLVAHAASSENGLVRIIDTVDSWLDKYPDHSAGPRAFLALIDPSHPVNILGKLIAIAQASPKVRDFLINGWGKTLEQTDVRNQAYQVLLSWSRAIHENQLDRNFTFGILTDVRNAHTPVDAMSRFLYGSPDNEDLALINARFALANLRACNHAQCSQPDCPLRAQSEVSKNGSAEENDNFPDE
ncbi:hypothetical protein [Streptosporangium sp. CA-115845]|uniref:hypothetical protein n=1 Tax=Streptosporangium sp. CA-115845 TaxID=3240071 RepID=UPI003D900336